MTKTLNKKKDNKWIVTGGGNIILEAKWGYISYNLDTSKSIHCSTFTTILNYFGVVDGEETALYDGKVWRILMGDFRKDYEKLFPSLKKCLKFYESKKDKFRSNYSTDPNLLKRVE